MAPADRPAVRFRGLGGAAVRAPGAVPLVAPEILDAAAARTGVPREVLAEYLDGNLHHDLAEEDEKGLAEFYRRAYAHGLLSSPDLPPFAGVPLVPRREG